jgi:hypothetical protein
MNAALPSTATPQVNEGRSPTRHWVIAYAASESEALPVAMNNAPDTLYLPNLQKLLSRMACVSKLSTSPEGASAFLMPHESAPQILGAKPSLGKEAIMSPCHWQVGMNEVTLLKPQELALNEDESRKLLSAIQPYFEEDGLQVVYESPLVWRVTGDLLDGLPLASIDRVVGQNIKPWMPEHQRAKTLQRLQSEMQMLLYQHPVNDERSLKGRWTVNSFWLHRRIDQLYPDAADLDVALDLRENMQASNAKLWQQAWEHLDATLCQSLCQALDQNHDVSLTLCSETSWRHYRPQPASWLSKLHRLIQPVSVIKELRALTSGVSAP